MKKSNLYTGRRVITRNGYPYVVMKGFPSSSCGVVDILVPLKENTPSGVLFLKYYTDDLRRQDWREDYEIIQVWESDFDNILKIPDDAERERLLWEREPKPKVIELTLEDIAKKFEVDVKQIKIKK